MESITLICTDSIDGINTAINHLQKRRHELIFHNNQIKIALSSDELFSMFVSEKCSINTLSATSAMDLMEAYISYFIELNPGIEVNIDFFHRFTRLLTTFMQNNPSVTRKYYKHMMIYSGIILGKDEENEESDITTIPLTSSSDNFVSDIFTINVNIMYDPATILKMTSSSTINPPILK